MNNSTCCEKCRDSHTFPDGSRYIICTNAACECHTAKASLPEQEADLGENNTCLVCNKRICTCPERNSDGSWKEQEVQNPYIPSGASPDFVHAQQEMSFDAELVRLIGITYTTGDERLTFYDRLQEYITSRKTQELERVRKVVERMKMSVIHLNPRFGTGNEYGAYNRALKDVLAALTDS